MWTWPARSTWAAVALLFPRDEGGYIIFVKFYIPEETARPQNPDDMQEKVNDQYDGWAIDGHLTLTPGNMIDQDYIKEDIIQLMKNHRVLELTYDPWQSNKLATELEHEGATCVEIKPTVGNFSDPMKMLEAFVLAEKIEHTGCPVLTWNVSNVVGHYDHKDNIYPNKEKPEKKIDGVVAILMAMNRGNHYLEQGGSIYEKRGPIIV